MTDNEGLKGSTPVMALPEAEPKYDVAISFLARDERVAGELNDVLGEG